MTLRGWLHYLSLRHYRSRLPWREARRFARHWRRCRASHPRGGVFPNSHRIAEALRTLGAARLMVPVVDPFRQYGALDDALLAFYGCPYTIFYAKTYRSTWSPARSGSQRWHADGGPGSCVIVMVYHTDVTDLDGPLEWVSWGHSLLLYRREPEGAGREALCDFYDRAVGPYVSVTGLAGTAILFSNNVLHRGGFPHRDHERLVTVYHCYPSRRDWGRTVPEKTGAYPRHPDI